MPQTYALPTEREEAVSTMKALVFYGPGQIGLETVPMPRPRAGEAVIRVTLTTICGTDLHIWWTTYRSTAFDCGRKLEIYNRQINSSRS